MTTCPRPLLTVHGEEEDAIAAARAMHVAYGPITVIHCSCGNYHLMAGSDSH